MRNARHIPCQLTVIAALLLSASSAPAQDNARRAAGRAPAVKNCSCVTLSSFWSPHREAPPFRTLSTRYPIEDLSSIGKGLFTGHPDMPEFVFRRAIARSCLTCGPFNDDRRTRCSEGIATMIKDILVNLSTGTQRDVGLTIRSPLMALKAHLAGVAFAYEVVVPETVFAECPPQ